MWWCYSPVPYSDCMCVFSEVPSERNNAVITVKQSYFCRNQEGCQDFWEMLLCRQGGWLWTGPFPMLPWAILMWGWRHSYSTLIWEWTAIFGTFSQMLNLLVQSTMHVAFNISEKLYFYAMRVLCNVQIVHTKACLKDVVSHWKKSKCSYLT